ncbi:alpha/beta fold hydrolase [Kibdelosporangium aridum]|nr:alpha/beta fold hydrolase [Kibdelosporangium aridum]
MRLFLAAAMALVFVAPAANAAPATTSTITWGACADQSLAAAGAECGTLSVPLNHSDPGGRKISLAVSRVKHKTTASKGTVVAVPDPLNGSGSGCQLSLLGARVPGGDAFDWVGFARRGVAPSSPAISCQPDYLGLNAPQHIPTSPAIEQQWLDKARGYAEACAAKNGELLDHMKSTDIAADVDLVRAALGADKVSLYAQAYGTYVAQVYSTLHPERVARMVLDDSIDPRRIWYYAANFDQNPPLQRNQDIWLKWLAEHDDVYHLGNTLDAVRQVWDEQLRRVTAQPAGGVFGQAEWINLFLYPAYTQQTWTLLGSAFSNWVHNGDAQLLIGLYGQFYLHPAAENMYGALTSLVCTDTAWPTNWNQWRADSWRTYAVAPDATWGNTWFNAPCLFWKAKPGKPVQIDGAKVDSALLVTESLSAVAPIEGSYEVRSRYPGARLLAVRDGVNFMNTLTGNACVDNQIAAYLATGELPARKPGRQADAVCAAAPAPVPPGA